MLLLTVSGLGCCTWDTFRFRGLGRGGGSCGSRGLVSAAAAADAAAASLADERVALEDMGKQSYCSMITQLLGMVLQGKREVKRFQDAAIGTLYSRPRRGDLLGSEIPWW